LGRSLDRLFEASGRTRQQWADALGVTRGALWQWSDCRTVPRAEAWLKILDEAALLGVSHELVDELVDALDTPLGDLGVKQPGRKDATLLEEIVSHSSRELTERLGTLPFDDALGVLDVATGHAHRTRRDPEWESELAAKFDRVVGQVVETAVDPEDRTVDRALLGAAAWRATYAWALARPDEAITEGRVTRIVNDAVRELMMAWGGSIRFPTY